MKYKIGNRVINASQIVQVRYFPAGQRGFIFMQCEITLTSVTALELDKVASNEIVILSDSDADAFWSAYSGDAYNVVV